MLLISKLLEFILAASTGSCVILILDFTLSGALFIILFLSLLIFIFSFFQISTLSSEASGVKKKITILKLKAFYLSLIISFVIFFLNSCFGAGKLILLNKNKTNKKARTYKKKLIIFFFVEVFELKRLL